MFMTWSVATETGYRDYLEVLDRADLLDLFPGVEKLKQRKEIFKIIHPQVAKILLAQAGYRSVQVCSAQMSH